VTHLRDLPREQSGIFDVLAIDPQIRAERGDLAQLERVRSSRGDHGDL
jgi:hypothetical protein